MTRTGDKVETINPGGSVTVALARQWHVALPSVYRYEDSKWIDEFFSRGLLRLSSFSRFAKYKDEVRGDNQEGFGVDYAEMPNGSSMMIVHQHGVSSLVLCCTHVLSRRLRQSFQRNSAFEITNTLAFAAEISRQIPGFQSGLEGSCIYRSDVSLKRKLGFNLEDFANTDGTTSMDFISQASSQIGSTERMLLKRQKYIDQREYRLAWNMDDLKEEYLDVFAPLAVQYCRRVADSEYHP